MTRFSPARWLFPVAAGALFFAAPARWAQIPELPDQESSSKDHDPDLRYKKPESVAAVDPGEDRLRADKDIDVGTYYMHKGNVDAAIDRFVDAAKARPSYALPHRLLGEAQEKKGLKAEALQSYQRYLRLYPHAEDAAKIRGRIQKLQEEVEKSARKSHGAV